MHAWHRSLAVGSLLITHLRSLATGTGFARVKTLLIGIMNKLVKSGITLQGFSIDNCCAWRLLLQGVFGVIPVKLDLFHAVQRIASKIKKGTH